ncbi:hypothetical protein G6F51_013932 [Rhizopus arrhizus]|uniref:Uncharacterized protein n=1 Tax=Rhizopus oryzae TaxID=64495 RepID=A0A9P6XQ33_RHIOR|nr:hypothetical protein G6F51_013932 [Rhizopus arrhizus]
MLFNFYKTLVPRICVVDWPVDSSSGPSGGSSTGSSMVCSLMVPDLIAAQSSDPFCQAVRRSTPLAPGFTDESGVLFFGARPVLPDSLKEEAFDLLHSNTTAGHLGVSRTLQR